MYKEIYDVHIHVIFYQFLEFIILIVLINGNKFFLEKEHNIYYISSLELNMIIHTKIHSPGSINIRIFWNIDKTTLLWECTFS